MIESQIQQMWDIIKFLAWIGAGAFSMCIAGFFYILNTKDGFEKKINIKVDEAVVLLTEIREALIGTLDKKGLKTMVYEHQKILEDYAEHIRKMQNLS